MFVCSHTLVIGIEDNRYCYDVYTNKCDDSLSFHRLYFSCHCGRKTIDNDYEGL